MIINDLPFYMIRSLLCTIVIEIGIGLICGLRDKKDIFNVLLVNIMTNPIVVSVPVFVLFWYGGVMSRIVLITLELLTVIGEGFVYLKTLNFKKINPFLLSLILNLGSYLIGEIINRLF